MADEYIDFCTGVQRLTGIDLGSYKRQQMERRMRTYVDRKAAGSLADFLLLIQKSQAELDGFLDRITINVSELYRNPEQYETLRTKVVPELRAANPMRVWSAGCSYGAEAFTVACMLSEELGGTARFEIVGSDIDRRVVHRAERGFFSEADMRSVPPKVRERWFERQDSGFQAREQLKNHLRFRREDLLRDRFQNGWDLVLCRNVVIYFTDEARNQVHEGLAKVLRPGGYLMVGSTERVAEPRAIGLEPVYPFIYRKVA